MPAWLALIACIAVIVIAAKAVPNQQRHALPCAIALSLGWIWFQSAFWGAYSPSQIIWDVTGAAVDPIWLWAAADAVVGFYIFTKAHERGWGFLLFMLFVGQELLHAVFEAEVMSYPTYSRALDVTFCLQIVCLIIGGRSGIAAWFGRRDDGGRMGIDRGVRASAVLTEEAEIG